MFKLVIYASLLTVASAINAAIAIFGSGQGCYPGEISGVITFTQESDGIHIGGEIYGLQPGYHGFHVHTTGICSEPGPHFNPHGSLHGGPDDLERHVGDLGNIYAGPNGIAYIDFYDNVIDFEGPNNIVGRSLVIHAGADDLGRGGFPDSLTKGHSGAMIACAVIQVWSE